MEENHLPSVVGSTHESKVRLWLTAAVPVAQVGEPPNIPRSDDGAHHSQYELRFGPPVSPALLLLGLLWELVWHDDGVDAILSVHGLVQNSTMFLPGSVLDQLLLRARDCVIRPLAKTSPTAVGTGCTDMKRNLWWGRLCPKWGCDGSCRSLFDGWQQLFKLTATYAWCGGMTE